MKNSKNDKTARVLRLYSKLINGGIVNKTEEALNSGVNERSIQRDIDDIRNFLENDSADGEIAASVVYDRVKKGYRLEETYKIKLSDSEVLAVCKILLESRALTKAEMKSILDRIIACCVPESNRKLIRELISNEEFHYIEPRHRTVFIDIMRDIWQAVAECRFIEIEYQRSKDKKVVKRKLMPLSIMFSEYYFYMAAFIDDQGVRKDIDVSNDPFPNIYRIDRIQNLTILEENFHSPYSSHFEEVEFRKKLQFMYGGELQKVKFRYSGYDIDAVLDRLPTAKILDENNGVYTISAEVFGKGIDMWFRSQGGIIERLE